MLHVHNVYKNYGALPVLQGVNLEINTPATVGLAGISGSGKSTLLRCIQQLEFIDKGEIKMDNNCCYMFQDFQLFPHMTVLENLTYAPKLKNVKNVDTQAQHLLDDLKIATKANAYPHQLSGGQKQRVALARCLMLKPKLLLCDEPTSGLDISSTQEVINLLNKAKDDNLTMLIASHDIEFLIQSCERIYILQEGKIVSELDTHQNNTQRILKASLF